MSVVPRPFTITADVRVHLVKSRRGYAILECDGTRTKVATGQEIVATIEIPCNPTTPSADFPPCTARLEAL